MVKKLSDFQFFSLDFWLRLGGGSEDTFKSQMVMSSYLNEVIELFGTAMLKDSIFSKISEKILALVEQFVSRNILTFPCGNVII